MECVIVEAALKTSFRKEMGFRNSPAAIFDDLCAPNNVQQNVVSSDDFIVDELLDFSNEDDEQDLVLQEDGEKQQTQQQKEFLDDKISEFGGKVDFECIPASELCVPSDDLASLEWLSHFVEDSNSEYSAPFPAGAFLDKPKLPNTHGGSNSSIAFCAPQKPVLTENCFKTPFPVKARSKRTRTGVRVWPLCSPSLTESSSSTSSSSSSSFSSPSSPCFLFTAPDFNRELTEPVFYEKISGKKRKNRFSGEPGSVGGGSQSVRRCSHCGVQKTPQWRAGPLGAKTLCNACGVRFKSGRLLPEYRPACSPTFSSEVHSNHHRKVLEMRKKKEVLGPAEPGLAAHEAPSF